ncbi:MAG: AbrB/MazE/SpoVT family DNA-binding domain-containing protein [Deltaproteobacteria bacterium]|nr:AbrB/MazE/SpoVT family DNA-binding domain-containing protein [Deltaproteobacteria bacterium]
MAKRRRKIDASAVIEAVESGRLSKDVMTSFGVEKPTKKFRRRGPRPKGELSGTQELTLIVGSVSVSQRGSVSLPRAMVDKLGFQEDDVFIVRKTKAGMILKPFKNNQ